MYRRWLQILALLVLVMGILPLIPVAAQIPCTVSTRGTVRLRAGHSTSDAIVGTMPRNTQLQVIERFVEQIGRRTRTWYRLVKEEAAPTSTAEQIWVGGTVTTSGDCGNVSSSGPTGGSGTGAATGPITGSIPQSGAWTLTYGNSVNVTCNNKGSAEFPTTDTFGQLIFAVNVGSNANGFALRGINYTQDANGTWRGSYDVPELQARGEAYIRVDTPTSILGDIVVTIASMPNCTFKFPFWASPR